MLALLASNLVLDIVFYIKIKPYEITDTAEMLKQEKLVSVIFYIHSGLEILFNVVLLAFLIS
jgi:hypothetical protein